MSDEQDAAEVIGGNAAAQLESYARRISEGLDQVALWQETVKAARAEAKADGYDLKVLNKCVKEMRLGAGYQAEQLEMELVLGTYREALGIATDLETAQKRAAKEAVEIPDDQPKRRRAERKDIDG